ncbi:choice-of-anchor L domain-containing protein [Nannocystaceae bacterium ST9]
MTRLRRVFSLVPCFALTSLAACSTDEGGGDELVDDGVNLETAGDQDDTTAGLDAEAGAESGSDGDPSDSTDPSGDGDGDGDESNTKFDLGAWSDGAGAGFCTAPVHQPCDDEDGDPWHAIGINCPGGYALTTQYTGDATAIYVHTAPLGTYNPPTYPALEGEKIVIMSSGTAQQLTVGGAYASTALPGNDPMILPAPMLTNAVGAQNCFENPALVGTGDCSNTINDQWVQGGGAFDYAEMRISGEVPQGASGFSYNLAFFSTEYPNFYQSTFNDMYIAWLQSDLWTGNVSFDEMGHPISLNAGFLDYKDAENPYDCPAPCQAPELQGTAMESHAGTKWLTTTAGVVPGEDFLLIFAIFDLSDNILDSAVILDNFLWNCEGGPPVTIPG